MQSIVFRVGAKAMSAREACQWHGLHLGDYLLSCGSCLSFSVPETLSFKVRQVLSCLLQPCLASQTSPSKSVSSVEGNPNYPNFTIKSINEGSSKPPRNENFLGTPKPGDSLQKFFSGPPLQPRLRGDEHDPKTYPKKHQNTTWSQVALQKFRENYMENSKNDGWWWVMIIFHKEFQALQPHKKVTFMAGGYPRGWIPDCRDETPSILPFLKWHAASRSFLILACFDMNFRSFSGSIQSHSIYSFSWDCILTISGFKTSRFQMLPDLQENFRARHGTWHRPRGVESTALEWTAASAAGPKRAKLSPRPHLGG